MHNREFNVLISSAGRRVRLLEIVRDSLALLGLKGRVIAADMSPLSAAFNAADSGFLVPPCRSPEFVPEMLELCRRQSVNLVVPTIDTELATYAASRERFCDMGTAVSVSSPEVIAIGGDKVATHDWLVGNDLPTVKQAPITDVLANPAAWRLPLIAKPRDGSASIGLVRIESMEALQPLAAKANYIVQEQARGREYTVDFLIDKRGCLVDRVARLRIETRAGEVSKGLTVRHAGVLGLVDRLCSALVGAYGCLNVQIFWDEEQQVGRIIEINPRFGGGFPLAWAAGAHFPKWLIEDLLGLKSSASFDGWRDKVMMLRYDAEVIVEHGAEIMGEWLRSESM